MPDFKQEYADEHGYDVDELDEVFKDYIEEYGHGPWELS